MPQLLPLFPLGTVLFPGVGLPLHIFEPRYRQLVHDLLEKPEPRRFGVVAIREGHEVGPDSLRALYDVGCIATITEAQPAPDGRFALMTVGDRRFRVVDLHDSLPYLQADIEVLAEPSGDEAAISDAVDTVRTLFHTYSTSLGHPELSSELPADATGLSYAVASTLAVALHERQQLLEMPTARERLTTETELLRREVAITQRLHAVPLANPSLPPSRLN